MKKEKPLNRIGESVITESGLRHFVRDWQHVVKRARFTPGKTALFTPTLRVTRYGLEWKTIKGRRCMRAADFRSTWRGKWRSMNDDSTPGEIYADLAGRIESVTLGVSEGLDPE